jgi:phosphate transport system permease protein
MYWNKKSNVEAPETADIVARLDWRNPAVISNYRNRKITNNLIKLFSLVSVLLVLYPVFDILYMFAYKGVLLLSIQTFTETTLAGGLSNAILGTIIIIGLSAGIAIPLGVFGGIYMAEFSDRSKYASVVRFVSDVLAGLPSIVVGYFGFLALVLYFNWGFSPMAAGITLSILMLPYIIRTTELSLRKVPSTIREAAIALGSSKSQMVNRLTLRFAMPGILTGILISVGIALSETAPLLYTAGFSNYQPCGLCFHSQTAYLTGIIYTFYTTPTAEFQNMAYLAAFLLILTVLLINVFARSLLRRFSKL